MVFNPGIVQSSSNATVAYELQQLPKQLADSSTRLGELAGSNHSKSSIAKRVALPQKSLGSNDDDGTLSPGARESNTRADNGRQPDVSSSTIHPLRETLTKEQKRAGLIQFLALCWCHWITGWNDGTLGPLLPRIQADYKLGYAIVSTLFVGNCAGYLTGAALNIWFNDRYGFGKVVVGAGLCQLVGYVILISAPPFPVIICAYTLIGFSMAILAAQDNGFVGSLRRNMSEKLGIMNALYGLGAFSSPFSATFFSSLPDRKWAFHFILSAAFALSNIIVLALVFRFRRREDVQRDAGQEPNEDGTNVQRGNVYKQIMKQKAMPWLTVFMLIYIGVEVTLGGWIVTFIIRERDGGDKSGYISSGFFGGLTAGRVGLMWLNEMVGAKRIILVYAVVAIGLELTIWLVPSIIENGVAVALVGVALGPMYPLLVSHMTHILPHWLVTGCIGLVTGVGMAGSAALPFITGLLASKFGISSLQPLMVSMMGCMVVVWALVPNAGTRVD